MKKNAFATFLVIIFGFSMSAKADYIKANYGFSSLADNVTKHANYSGTKIDTDDEGYSVTAGINVLSNIGVEAMYYDLGTTTITGNKGDVITFDKADYQFSKNGTVKNDTSGYGIGFFGTTGDSSGFLSFSATGRLGVHVWDRSGSTTAITDTNSTLKNSFYNDGADLYYGIEIDTGITESMSFNISLDGMSFADAGLSTDDMATMIGLGLKLNF